MPFSVPSTLDKHMRKCEKNPQYHHNLQNQSNENLLDLNNNNNNVIHKKVNHVKKEKASALAPTAVTTTPVIASSKNEIQNNNNLPAGIQFNQVDNDDEQDFADQYQDDLNYDEDEQLHEAEINEAVEDAEDDDDDDLAEMYDESDEMLRESEMIKEELENDYDDEVNENDLDSASIQPQTVNQLLNNTTSSAQRSVNRRKLNMSSRKQYNRNQQAELFDENNNDMDDLNGSAHLNSAGDDDEELDETEEAVEMA